MQSNRSNQENPIKQQQEISPAELSSLLSSFKASSDPASLTTENNNNTNNVVNDDGEKLDANIFSNSIKNNITTKDQDETNMVGGTTSDDENVNPKPLLKEDENDNELTWTLPPPSHNINNNNPAFEENFGGDIPKRISLRRSFQRENPEENNRRNSMGQLFYKSCNNNNNEEDFMMTESNAALLGKTFLFENDSNWKRDRGDYGDFVDDLPVRFPWKRIAYIGVLLVLGVTCAILVLMKLCGGAEWMNTATFAVIIMGTVMLLPPGLYYGRILICITCRCKGYTLWDVPAGPFG